MSYDDLSVDPRSARATALVNRAVLLGWLSVPLCLVLLGMGREGRRLPAPVAAADVLAVRTDPWVVAPGARLQRLVAVAPERSLSAAERRAAARKVLAADLSATMTDVLVPGYDADGGGDLDPGEKLLYHVVIANAGPDAATNVSFDLPALDPNTTLVADSRQSSPVAFDDAYDAIGNVQAVVSAADGVLQGGAPGAVADVDPDPGAVLAVVGVSGCGDVVAPFDCATAHGGTVSLSADGAFTYTPPPGFEGDDTFAYVLSDGTTLPDGALGGPADGQPDPMPTSDGTVTLAVAEVIWFVDDGVSGGTGRSDAPFNLDEYNASVLDEAGDFVFLRSGTHAGDAPLQLLDGQTLVGEGVSLEDVFLARQASHASVPVGATLPGAGAPSVITSPSSAGLALASGNTVAGLVVSGTGGAGIVGTGVNSGTFASVLVENTGGSGVSLANAVGTFTFEATAITNAGGAAFSVDGGTASVGFASGAITQNTTAPAVRVNNHTTGTLDFDIPVSGATGSANGVDLTGFGTVRFDGGLALSTGAGGITFRATTAGTLHVTGAGNSLASVSGQALVLNGVGLGDGNVAFGTIAASSAQGDALAFTNVSGPGAFTVNDGDGGTANDVRVLGGTADGIDINGASAAFSFSSVALDAVAAAGVQVTGTSGPVNVSGGAIGATDDPAGNAVDVAGGNGAVTVAATVSKASPGRIVEVTGRTGGEVTVAGNLTCVTGCTGLNLDSNTAGTTTFSGSSKVLNTGASAAVTITTNAGHTVHFTNGGLDIDATSGTGFSAAGGTVSVSGPNNTINVTGGTALNAANVAFSDATFSHVSAAGGGSGVALANTSGTLTMQSGILAGGPSGPTFHVSGGNPAVTYSGSVMQSNTGVHVVNIDGTTGGSVTFNTGTVTGGAASAGLQINNANGAVSFANLTLGTAGARMTRQAVTISGGSGAKSLGVVSIFTSNVTGIGASGSTGAIATTSGTVDALNATAVSIAGPATNNRTPLNVQLTTVNASGGTNGILVSNASATGIPGGFRILGNSAGLCGGAVAGTTSPGTPAGITAPVTGDCSGGTIANTVSDGMRFSYAEKVSLTRVQVNNSGQSGIFGTEVNGFELIASRLHGNGNNVDEVGLKFGDVTNPGSANGLLGTATNGTHPTRIVNSTISQSGEYNVEVVNVSGTLTDLFVDGSQFTDTRLSGSGTGADGFQVELQGSATGTVNIEDSYFANNFTQGAQLSAISNAVLNVSVRSSTFLNNHEGFVCNHSANADLNCTVGGDLPTQGNTFQGYAAAESGALVVLSSGSSSTSSASLTGKVKNNHVAPPATMVNHSIIAFLSGTNTPASVAISNNTVNHQAFGNAILVDTPDNITSPQFSVTVSNNTITNTAGAGHHGAVVQARKSATACVLMQGNAGSIAGGASVARVRAAETGTLRLKKGNSGSTIPQTVMQDNHLGQTVTASAGAPGVITVVENGACTTPTAMNVEAGGTPQNLAQAGGPEASADPSLASTVLEAEDAAPVALAEPIAEPVAEPVAELVAEPVVAPTGGAALAEAETRAVQEEAAPGAVPEALPDGAHAAAEAPAAPATPRLLASTAATVDALDLAKARVRGREARLAGRTALPAGDAVGRGAAVPQAPTAPAMAGEFPVNIGTLPAGKPVHVFFEVQVADPVTAGAANVANQGVVTAGGGLSLPTDDPDVGGAADPTTTALQSLAVLGAVKSVSDAAGNDDGDADPGETLTYTVTVTNTGNAGVAALVITDAAPAHTTFVEGSAQVTSNTGGGTVDAFTGDEAGEASLALSLSGLAGGGGAVTVTFLATVDSPSAPGAAQVENAAQVSATGIPAFDSNTATLVLDAAPSLSVTKTAQLVTDDGTAGKGNPGDVVRYTVTVANGGNQGVATLRVDGAAPAHTTLVAGSVALTDQTDGGTAVVASGNTPGDTQVSVTAPLLAGGGDDVAFTFDVVIDGPLPGGVDQLSNQATATADDAAADDVSVTSAAATTDLDPARLVLNEFDYHDDDVATGLGDGDAAEFIEIKNTGASGVDLDPYALALVDGTGNVYRTIELPVHTLDTGAGAADEARYYVVCFNRDLFAPPTLCDQDEAPELGQVTDAVPAAIALLQGSYVVDVVAYGGTVPAFTEGTGTEADDNSVAFRGFSRWDGTADGVDTDDNAADFSLRCVTPGGPNAAATAGCTTPLPVELVAFTASADGAAVALAWTTASETNNAGFEVELRRQEAAAWQVHGFVAGAGTTAEARRYAYRITELVPGHYRFRLRQVDYDGAFSYGPEVEVALDVPRALVLMPNYPNPFNPATTIAFTVPEAGHAVLRVFNVVGQEVAVLYDGVAEAGTLHEVRFSAEALSTGLYVYTLEYNGQRRSRSFVLLK